MSEKKIHFNDQHGAICGGRLLLGNDWKSTKPEDLGKVTCKRCIRRLREIGFAVQHFNVVVRETVK